MVSLALHEPYERAGPHLKLKRAAGSPPLFSRYLQSFLCGIFKKKFLVLSIAEKSWKPHPCFCLLCELYQLWLLCVPQLLMLK